MEKDLVARREQAEKIFSELQNLQQTVAIKLKEFGLNSYNDIETELARLQGEYRLVDDLLSKKAKPSKVSPKAEVVDVDKAVS